MKLFVSGVSAVCVLGMVVTAQTDLPPLDLSTDYPTDVPTDYPPPDPVVTDVPSTEVPSPDGSWLNAPTTYPPPTTTAPPDWTETPSTTAPPGTYLSGSDGSGSYAVHVQMDFGSVPKPSTGGAWYPIPTASTDAWNIDWTWNGTWNDTHDASSASDAGYPTYDDDVGVEVAFDGIDGSIEHTARRKYYFDDQKGFRLMTTEGIEPGNCSYPACIHLVFESDYGAMTPFDAFVLDRVESAMGPVELITDAWTGDGPVPLVLGRLSNETKNLIQDGTTNNDVFNWNETRRTIWTLHPTNESIDEIDVTLSLKQLYTFLPGYNGSDPSSNGPFYSSDLTDQVIIRVNGQVPSPFAGSSAMLPIIVNHTGSQLVDINMTSTLLYEGAGVNGGNEIEITFTLTRRKYGGALPWFPAKSSPECARCEQDQRLPDAFSNCLDDQLNQTHLVFHELLDTSNNSTRFDIGPFAEACFHAIVDGEWINGTNTTAPQRVFDGLQWIDLNPPDPVDVEKRWALLRDTNEALRCWTESQCPIGGGSLKMDAQVVVLREVPAKTILEFDDPQFSFYIELMLNNSDGSPRRVRSPYFRRDATGEDIATGITHVIPEMELLNLDIEVRVYNNSNEIQAIRDENNRLMEAYNQTLRWTASSRDSNSDSNSGSTGASEGDTGMDNGSEDSSSSSGFSGTAGYPEPLVAPTLQPLPSETYTIEILCHNITPVAQIVSVVSDYAQVTYNSTDKALWFEVMPLDVNKFEYVPPPPYVDLSWSPEPAWMTEVRRRLPTFAANDSCGQCLDEFQACLFDIDCAFGVDNYLSDALMLRQLWPRIQTITDPFKNDSLWYKVDLTDVLRNASAFFPSDGWSKFKQLLDCWSATVCDLEVPRLMANNAPVPTTRLTIQPAMATVKGRFGSTFQIFMENQVYNFTAPNGSVFQAFQVFLENIVLRGASPDERDFVIKDMPERVPSGYDFNFDIYWLVSTMERFQINDIDTNTHVEYHSGAVSINQVIPSVLGWKPDKFQWSRLEQWLDLFRFVPSSSFPPGYHDGNNGTFCKSDFVGSNCTNWTSPNPENPIPSSPPSAVCLACADVLQTCIGDVYCLTTMQKWLPTLFPDPKSATADWDGIYRTYWNTSVLNSDPSTVALPAAYRTPTLMFASCLATKGCPVGVGNISTSYPWGPVFPTTVKFETMRSIYVPHGGNFQMYYKGLYVFQTDDTAANLGDYLDKVQYEYGEIVNFTNQTTDNNLVEITFIGSMTGIDNLVFLGGDPPFSVGDITYKGWFESHTPVVPSWDYLLRWYGITPPTTVTECKACQPKIEACFEDTECWNSVQTAVVPWLKQPQPWKSQYDSWTGRVLYEVKMSDFNQDIDSPPAATSVFKTPSSWQLFTDILVCFGEAACDVETMDSALEPPATAHIPSFIAADSASASLLLYLNTQLRVQWYDQSFDYTETATGLIDPLKSFFETAFAGTNASINVTWSRYDDTNHLYEYNVTFGDTYFGRLPQLLILSPGDVTLSDGPSTLLIPWRFSIESVNQVPRWDFLTNLLSSPPPSSSVPTNDTTFDCPTALAMRSACHAMYGCQTLLGMTLPMFQNLLETAAPAFNSATQLFELDLTSIITTQLAHVFGPNELSSMLDMMRESAHCAAQSLPSSAPQPVFHDLRISFERPAHGPVYLTLPTGFFTFPDDSQDPNVDRIKTFENFVYTYVMAQSPYVQARHWFGALDNGVMKHDFEFDRLYVSPPPHLSGFDIVPDVGPGPTVDSIDSPWTISFQSPTFALNNAFAPWLAWLSTDST